MTIDGDRPQRGVKLASIRVRYGNAEYVRDLNMCRVALRSRMLDGSLKDKNLRGFARSVGLSLATISKWFNGIEAGRKETTERILGGLKLSFDDVHRSVVVMERAEHGAAMLKLVRELGLVEHPSHDDALALVAAKLAERGRPGTPEGETVWDEVEAVLKANPGGMSTPKESAHEFTEEDHAFALTRFRESMANGLIFIEAFDSDTAKHPTFARLRDLVLSTEIDRPRQRFDEILAVLRELQQ